MTTCSLDFRKLKGGDYIWEVETTFDGRTPDWEITRYIVAFVLQIEDTAETVLWVTDDSSWDGSLGSKMLTPLFEWTNEQDRHFYMSEEDAKYIVESNIKDAIQQCNSKISDLKALAERLKSLKEVT